MTAQMTPSTSNPAGTRTWYGKYRGTVVNNIDPKGLGRLLVAVPDVLGLVPSSWAEACVPLAGPTGTPMGAWFVPPTGAGVWVEFEAGDPSRPIWTGCRWGTPADPPTLAKAGLPVSPSIVLQTAGQQTLAISDLPGPTGGIMLKSATGATLIVNDTGIYIQNGKGASIVMTGPTVTVNNGALTVV
ncbi:phage baseplate assembly protein V [Blastococcus saxobsidens]|nr:phage baseplate assembly protein V [Blastococcus saxobsidens]